MRPTPASPSVPEAIRNTAPDAAGDAEAGAAPGVAAALQ